MKVGKRRHKILKIVSTRDHPHSKVHLKINYSEWSDYRTKIFVNFFFGHCKNVAVTIFSEFVNAATSSIDTIGKHQTSSITKMDKSWTSVDSRSAFHRCVKRPKRLITCRVHDVLTMHQLQEGSFKKETTTGGFFIGG